MLPWLVLMYCVNQTVWPHALSRLVCVSRERSSFKRLTWFLSCMIVTRRSEQMEHSQVYCHAGTTERLQA